MKSMLMSLLFLFQSPPAALSQGIAQTVVDHVVKVEVLALHLPITTRGPQSGYRADGSRPCSQSCQRRYCLKKTFSVTLTVSIFWHNLGGLLYNVQIQRA
jgi:hypothetical protein